MKPLLLVVIALVVLAVEGPTKIAAQTPRAPRTIEGTITDYSIGGNFNYLSVTDGGGREYLGICAASPLCANWKAAGRMPNRFKGQRVLVTVGRCTATPYDGWGNPMSEEAVFTGIQLLTGARRASTQPDETRPSVTAQPGVDVAEPGFYVRLTRGHDCVSDQPDALTVFHGRGISAFYGNPGSDDSSAELKFLEMFRGSRDFGSLFVGPFRSEAAAKALVSQIPTILSRQIAEDQREEREQAARRIGSSSSPKTATGFFDVSIVRVLSKYVTGNFANFRPEDYVIRPGIGIGRVRIGSSRTEVLAAFGEPRVSAFEALDVWKSGDEQLKVWYSEGVVIEMSVSSPKFHTALGLNAASNSREFLKAFPGSKIQCCIDAGRLGFVSMSSWDAVAEGIALQEDGENNVLIVHPVNKEAIHASEQCQPCHGGKS